MPVTDLYGGALDGSSGLPPGWTIGPDGAPIMANAGAAQPYGQSGYPDNLPNRPYGPPGGGVMGYPGATSGAPSMGYPALGPGAYAAPVPPTLPSPGVTPTQFTRAGGLTVNSNPLMRALNALNPISSAQADVLHPNLTQPNMHPLSGNSAPSPSPLLRATAADSLPLAWGNPTSEDYRHWLDAQLNSPAAAATATPSGPSGPSGGIGSDARFPLASTPLGQGGIGSDANFPLTGGVRRGGATTQAPGAGAPAGNPAPTPRPPKTSSKTPNLGYYQPPPRFGTVQYQVPGSPGVGQGQQSRAPIYTTLNLFGGGGQAANPANIPAANAQPVSGTLPTGGMSNAPWGMGPLQQWMHWPGSFGPFTPDQIAGRSLKQRYG